MFFDGAFGLLRVVIVALCAYAAVILTLRLAGKRALAKLNAFDFVVTVALGSTLATVLLSADVAFAEGVLAFAMLALLQWAVSRLSIASRPFRKLIRSQPRLVFEDGAYRHEAMRDERITEDEIAGVVRAAGVGRLEDVAAVVLETDGSLSVIARADDRDAPLTALANVRR